MFDFLGGPAGPWQLVRMTALAGEALAPVSHLQPRPGTLAAPAATPES